MLVGKVSLAVLCSATLALGSSAGRGTTHGFTGKRSSFGSGRYHINLSIRNDKKCLDALDEQNRQACDDQITKIAGQIKGVKVHHIFNFAKHCSMSIEAEDGFFAGEISKFMEVTGVYVVKVVSHPGGLSIPVPPPAFVSEPTQRGHGIIPNHDLGPPPPSAYRNNLFAPHVETEVNLMHDLGLLGSKDVSVCLVDTGVDYTNSRLGGGFGKGYKVAMGHDFMGDDGRHSGASPYTTCTDHGTHVTGIVGANFDSDFKFSGVAPNVTLGHYRAFDCTGQSSEDIIAAALLRAHRDGCNVITLSLGGPSAWEDGLLAETVTHVTNQGSLVVSSSGNFGRQGLFYGDVPGELPEVLGTAATDLTEYPVGYTLDIVDSSYQAIPYFAVFPVSINETLDVVYIPPSIADDPNCDPTKIQLPNGNLENSLLVFELGQCSQPVVVKWALANKLRVAMVYVKADNPEIALHYYSTHFVRELNYFLCVQASSAKKLISYYKANGDKLQVSFAARNRASVEDLTNHVSGGNMAFYSSYGPTAALEGFAKTLAAPGTNILSTLNVAQGGVGVMSGTSMACPLAAGIAALLFSHRKADNLTPLQVKSLMATTAQPLRIGQSAKDPFATVVHQGAGIVSAHRAYIAKTLIEPYSIALGDVKNFHKSHTITLKNTNTNAVTYTFSSVFSQTVTTYDKGASIDINPSGIPRPGIPGAANVTFSPRSLTIAPGESATFTATFAFPRFSQQDLDRVPIVSGWIVIDSPNEPVDRYRIAYAGVATSLQVMPILDSTDVASPLFGIQGLHHPFIMIGSSSDPDALPSSAEDVLSDPNKVTQVHRKDGIFVFVRFAMATRYLQADLVDVNTTFEPTIPPSNNLHLAQGGTDSNLTQHLPQNSPASHTPLFASVPILGTVSTETNANRDATDFRYINSHPSSRFNFNGLVAVKHSEDGPKTNVTAGTPYRILVRALRLDSDSTSSAGCDSWLSPPFQFLD